MNSRFSRMPSNISGDCRMEPELLFDGMSFRVFRSGEPDCVTVEFTDTITAFGGIKRAEISGKGEINASIASMVAEYIGKNGVESHFIRQLDSRRILCRKVEMIRLEVVVRNIIAGSMARRLGVREGMKPENTIFDLFYKNEDLGSPLINDHYAVALGLVTYGELTRIYEYAGKINGLMSSLLKDVDIELVDFKLEFGRDGSGNIVVADELTPDNARLWDMKSMQKLDRDRFRRDMGKVGEAYRTICGRLRTVLRK